MTLRLISHLPLRQAEGFLHSLFGMMRLDLSAPDYTTLSRRSQHLRRRLRLVPPGGEGPLVRVTADAAYDTVVETARARGTTVVVPPASTANVSGHGPWSPARDRTMTLVKTLGRCRWKQASGYHRQGRVENAFFRYTSIIGDGLRARSPAGQGSGAVLGCAILNRITDLGRPASYRICR